MTLDLFFISSMCVCVCVYSQVLSYHSRYLVKVKVSNRVTCINKTLNFL